ncbi:OLC1v1007953C1 [Oldenlandia corymbosa var. corymbosa]|uniref:OLC1v1007953C1 n=1 Tax=Oldenlandia corymbosa var. corymbosa TaxID=529605 RepID=A0AAV1DKN6_OLDCO|nr:OLC1v1007953C1 [Oldenlandia corymbosa var. corymbosa]
MMFTYSMLCNVCLHSMFTYFMISGDLSTTLFWVGKYITFVKTFEGCLTKLLLLALEISQLHSGGLKNQILSIEEGMLIEVEHWDKRAEEILLWKM